MAESARERTVFLTGWARVRGSQPQKKGLGTPGMQVIPHPAGQRTSQRAILRRPRGGADGYHGAGSMINRTTQMLLVSSEPVGIARQPCGTNRPWGPPPCTTSSVPDERCAPRYAGVVMAQHIDALSNTVETRSVAKRAAGR